MKIVINEPAKHSLTVIQHQTKESIVIKETSVTPQSIIKISELGSPGLSAYELAVQGGFQGSFQDWFNTYDISIINGGIIF